MSHFRYKDGCCPTVAAIIQSWFQSVLRLSPNGRDTKARRPSVIAPVHKKAVIAWSL